MTLSARERAALAQFEGLLRNPERVLQTWRTADLFEEHGQTGVSIEAGRPMSPAIPKLERGYRQKTGRDFPELLGAMLRLADGLDVDGIHESLVRLTRSDDLGSVLNGLRPAGRIEVESAGNDDRYVGLAFAVPYGQEPIIIDEATGHLVFDDNRGEPLVVAPSLVAFVESWCSYGLSLTAVVGGKLDAFERDP